MYIIIIIARKDLAREDLLRPAAVLAGTALGSSSSLGAAELRPQRQGYGRAALKSARSVRGQVEPVF